MNVIRRGGDAGGGEVILIIPNGEGLKRYQGDEDLSAPHHTEKIFDLYQLKASDFVERGLT